MTTKKPVCDLDALDADESGEPFAFRFGGEDYALPPKIDLRAVAALEGNRYDAALRMLLGPLQWERMQASPAVFDQRKFEALFAAYGKHQGVDSLGESSASTGS